MRRGSKGASFDLTTRTVLVDAFYYSKTPPTRTVLVDNLLDIVSNRIPKVNSLIKKELANLLLKEVDFPKDVLVTVSRVDCSPDLIQAKVYLTCLKDERWPEIEKILKKNIWILQKKLDKMLKMRPVPKIIFLEDKQASEAARVEELLARIKEGND